MSARVLHGFDFTHSIDESTLGDFFFKNAEKYKDRICHIDATLDQAETYGSIKLRSTRVALALQKRGITSQDVIAFCSANTLDNTIPMLACFYLGAKVVNVVSSLSVRHTKHLLTLTTPKLIFVEECAVEFIEKSLIGTTFETEIIVFGSSEIHCVFFDLVQPHENEKSFRPVAVDPDDTAWMFFSSGVTGLTKAVCHSHRSFLWITLQAYQNGAHGTMFHFTTFYWITAGSIFAAAFISGSTRVFARHPHPTDVFKIINKYKVTFVHSAPVITYKLTKCQNCHHYDTSSLRLYVCSGTTMTLSQLRKMNRLFPSAITFLFYGMTEMGITSCFNVEVEPELVLNKLSSCGRPAPGVQLKVVDLKTGELLGCNQKGEIRTKALSMMTGYYRGDFSQVFDDEGYLMTADVGYYDGDGCVYVTSRIREMFKYKSWHIIPSSIEAALLEHPKIEEAVVYGLACGKDGEVPAACVVVKHGNTLNEREIDDFMKEIVADRERLRGGVTFVDALPKSSNGKIARTDVKEFIHGLKKNK